MILLLSACALTLTVPRRADDPDDDFDGDGVTETGGDCDDEDADVTFRDWYLDADLDGYGAGPDDAGDTAGGAPGTVRSCEAQTGFAALAGDCNDADPDIHPGAEEDCGNGVDDNCDDVSSCSFESDAAALVMGASVSSNAGATLRAWESGPDGPTLLIGEPGADTVYLLPVDEAGAYTTLDPTIPSVVGAEVGARFGAAVAEFTAADGTDRLLVGGPAREGSAGGAWLYSADAIDSSHGPTFTADADWVGTVGEAAGSTVEGFYAEDGVYAAIGAPADGSALARVYLAPLEAEPAQSLRDASALTGSFATDGAAMTFTTIARDGLDALVVAIPREDDPLVLIYTDLDIASGGAFVEADASTALTADVEGFGTSIASVGDLDRDGNDDLAVGSPTFDEGRIDDLELGQVDVYLSDTTGLRSGSAGWVRGADAHAWLGSAIARGPTDDDGFGSFIAGGGANICNRESSAAGAWLVYGVPHDVVVTDPDAGTVVAFSRGKDPCGLAGNAVAAFGDDRAVALGNYGYGDDQEGSVLVYPGPWVGP